MTPGHALIAPKRHDADLVRLTIEEGLARWRLLAPGDYGRGIRWIIPATARHWAEG